MSFDPQTVIWPTQSWPRESPSVALHKAINDIATELFDLPRAAGHTLALFVTRHGKCIYEQYAEGVDATTSLPSWSMAKSMVHALVGILVARNALSVNAPAPVDEWQGDTDPRKAITLDNLLTMRSGLEFVEDYVDDRISDVIQMLWGRGATDVAAYAANKPLLHEPGRTWSYSSGTTNIVSRILSRTLASPDRGAPEDLLTFMFRELFDPIGMHTPIPKFDETGTFKGSSFCFCSVEDFARFGYLYLRDGIWANHRILPEGWVAYAQTPVYMDEESGYGAHWWITPDRLGFYASGYEGQHILIVPSKDLVMVKLGKSPVEYTPILLKKVKAIAELF